jgi:hypothetical protein
MKAAIAYIIDATPSDYLSESDIECLELGPVVDLLEILTASELRHVGKYGRVITGRLYMGQKETTTYNRRLVAKIEELANVFEIVEYLRGF